MSFLTDSIGLSRQAPRSTSRRFNLDAVTTRLDELAAPARLLRLYFEQRAELKAARRALELSLMPKVSISLQCKSPDGRVSIHLLM